MPDIFTLVTPDRFWMFLASGLLLNLTPGADVMFATASGLRSGPRVGAAAGLGVGLGGIWHVGLAALGITALLAALPAALVALKWLGAAYLLWLAWNSWNAGAASATEGGMTAAAAIRRGFLTNALNPKVALFILAFTTIFSVFVNAPLLELADVNKTPNPSKAPWYFLGLQELLTMFHPMVAGVTIPGMGIFLLILAPYVDKNPSNKPEDRKFAIGLMTVHLMFWAVLVMIGSFFRGPGFNFTLPWRDGLFFEL